MIDINKLSQLLKQYHSSLYSEYKTVGFREPYDQVNIFILLLHYIIHHHWMLIRITRMENSSFSVLHEITSTHNSPTYQ